MKYRKKPIVIEAYQWMGDMFELRRWVNEVSGDESIFSWDEDRSIGIQTLEGRMICSIHDYVIRGIKGEFYPCKPDIFEKTYEPIQ